MKGVTLLEKQIQQTCSEFLELDGWRCFKMEPVSNLAWGKGANELGQADCMYVRYCPSARDVHRDGVDPGNPRAIGWWQKVIECQAEVMHIEWKRLNRGGKPTKAGNHQRDWHARERARGALTLIAGEDFSATIEGFQAWYRQSGLNRRMH